MTLLIISFLTLNIYGVGGKYEDFIEKKSHPPVIGL